MSILKSEKMPKLSFYDDYDYNEEITIIVLREAREKIREKGEMWMFRPPQGKEL